MTDQAVKAETKVSLWVKVQTGLLAAILILLIVAILLLAGSVKRLDHSLELVQADLEALEMDKVNEAVASLTEAADRLAAVDVERLNAAIGSLKEAADTLKEFDIESFNGVVEALNNAVTGLQNVSNAIGGIFH